MTSRAGAVSARRLAAAPLLLLGHPAVAQGVGPRDTRPPAGAVAILATNAVVGGLTAAVHAAVARRDPARAFARGALGGAVHFAGKLIASQRGDGAGLAGLVVAGTGTSIVANSGRGVGPFDELVVPVGPLRLRFAPLVRSHVHLGINAFESLVLARHLTRRGLSVDWQRSASTGTFVFDTHDSWIVDAGDTVSGITVGSVVVLSAFAPNARETFVHERTHVHQLWFLQETWGRPLETYLRRRVPGGSAIPDWLELGVLSPSIMAIDDAVFSHDGPLNRLLQSEAEWFERR